MNNNRLVALGLILFVVIFTIPVLMNLGKTTVQTQPPDALAMQGLADKLGVKNEQEYREKHMQILSEWKGAVVRDGKRIYVTQDGREIPMSMENLASQSQYCNACHDYAGIEKPKCWTCHVAPDDVKGVK